MNDIKMAAREGANFIRIGQDITKIDECKSFVILLKNAVFTVFVNAMKTYLISPVILRNIIIEMNNWENTDIFYIVDFLDQCYLAK